MDCRSVGRSKRLVCSGTIVNVTTRRVMLSRWVRYCGCLAIELVVSFSQMWNISIEMELQLCRDQL